ncbi:hypothetical protein [Nonomuraea africana]|uniref:Transposase IS204/IS1001/IS1096/IS1165 DDE domain-containing protein n=1 Tax=Nonomuraea africana TaxID=46171 RepID=A0ABR9KDL8_9ACTN|nr:hypothetical protein [Nonomuraea africana]MBE1560084.1 hypothetical protein [Nonomuraea africana]
MISHLNHQFQLKAVLARCPELTTLVKHVRSFAIMLTQRQGQDLPGWLAAVKADDELRSLHAFRQLSGAGSRRSHRRPHPALELRPRL